MNRSDTTSIAMAAAARDATAGPAPARGVLVLGGELAPVVAALLPPPAGVPVIALPWPPAGGAPGWRDDLGRLERVGMALVNLMDAPDPDLAVRTLAHLRDVGADRLWAIAAHPGRAVSGLDDVGLRALGLVQVARYPDAAPALALYGYDVATYKPTPDWLNASRWAHPERWNKERW